MSITLFSCVNAEEDIFDESNLNDIGKAFMDFVKTRTDWEQEWQEISETGAPMPNEVVGLGNVTSGDYYLVIPVISNDEISRIVCYPVAVGDESRSSTQDAALEIVGKETVNESTLGSVFMQMKAIDKWEEKGYKCPVEFMPKLRKHEHKHCHSTDSVKTRADVMAEYIQSFHPFEVLLEFYFLTREELEAFYYNTNLIREKTYWAIIDAIEHFEGYHPGLRGAEYNIEYNGPGAIPLECKLYAGSFADVGDPCHHVAYYLFLELRAKCDQKIRATGISGLTGVIIEHSRVSCWTNTSGGGGGGGGGGNGGDDGGTDPEDEEPEDPVKPEYQLTLTFSDVSELGGSIELKVSPSPPFGTVIFKARHEFSYDWQIIYDEGDDYCFLDLLLPGNIDLMAEVQTVDEGLKVLEKSIRVNFPSANNIKKNPTVVAAMEEAWRLTKAAAKATTCREYGFAIYANTSGDNIYKIMDYDCEIIEGEASGYFGERASITFDYDLDQIATGGTFDLLAGGRFLVADFHTHPPYSNYSGPVIDRGVGPSTGSGNDLRKDESGPYGIPSFVYDYIGQNGRHASNHPINSSTDIYIYGGTRRNFWSN